MGSAVGRVRTAGTAPARWVDRLLPDRRSRSLAVRVLIAAAAVLVVAVGTLSVMAVHESRIDSARIYGLSAAVDLTPKLLTYDYRTLDADAAEAQASITGDFAGQYKDYFAQLLSPNAKAQQFVSKATVRAASEVSATADQVVALIYLDQATTSKALTAPRLDNSGVRVTVTEVGGRWLISKLDRL